MNKQSLNIRKMSNLRACAKFFEMTEAEVKAEAGPEVIAELGVLAKVELREALPLAPVIDIHSVAYPITLGTPANQARQ